MNFKQVLNQNQIRLSFFSKVNFVVLLWILGMIACQSDNRKKPEIGQPLPVKILRFDQELFRMDTNNVAPGLKHLAEIAPDFTSIFVENLIATDPPQSPEKTVEGFIRFPSIKSLYDTCRRAFPDMSAVEKQLGEAMAYYQVYFPQQKMPEFLTFISEYGNAIITYGDSSKTKIGIGLDLFLGADHPPYTAIYPSYIKNFQTKEQIVPQAMEAIATDMVGNPKGNRLLDLMIYYGKILYVQEALLPNMSDSALIRYTETQMKWCKDNEADIWAHFVSENLLYSTEKDKIQKLVSPSPNSPGMPIEAPGRTGVWTGWQIVRSFMNNNPDISVQQLLAYRDAQVILDKAKYKPKRNG